MDEHASDSEQPEVAPDPAERFQRAFLILLVLGISLVFLWMVRSFLIALLLAAIFAGMSRPLYARFCKWLGGRESLSAAIVVLLVLLLIVGPLTGFLTVVARQALEVSQGVRPWVETQLQQPGGFEGMLERIPFADRLLPSLEGVIPDRDELAARVGEAVSKAGTFLVEGLASFTRGTAGFLLDLFILLYAMFFFLISGREILDRILYYLPLPPENEDELVGHFTSVSRATLKGSIVIGVLQGGLAGLAFWAAGIGGAAFWGTVMAVLSVIPGVGAPIVWVPAAIWLFATGQTGAAVGLTVWCAGLVGSIDNVLRPRLVGADAKMPDLLILLGTLGGISLFGPVGFLLGPVVAALFVTIWEIYGHAFSDWLPQVSRPAA